MGLAASQARFLNLTARKTNLEYEGQQINQQRTTLANQSANIYNQMLTLSVPTPPSETSFQTIQYNFTYGGNSYSINQVTGKDSNATVLTTETYTNNYAMNASEKVVSKDDSKKYYVGSAELKLVSAATDTDVADAANDIKTGMQAAWDADVAKGIRSAKTINTSDIYFVNVGDDKNPVYRYYFASDVTGATYNADNKSTVTTYTAGSNTEYAQKAFKGATITRDANNRIVAINHSNLGSTSLSVTSTTIKDQAAYDDAYNEYEYQTYLYEQKMNAINAETSVIQAQDKKLELRLKQLDTEQNAISTEMESVSSVVKKNVEDTFKIFA